MGDLKQEDVGMDYDNGFILQKTVDWSLLRSSYARLLPKGRKSPRLNRKKFQFDLANGEVLSLKLYEHLKVL